MSNTFDLLLQDPVVFSCGIILLAALAFFFWILLKLQHEQPDQPVFTHSDQPRSIPATEHQEPPVELSGLSEARLREISSQISDLNQKIAALQKSMETIMSSQTEALIDRMAPILKSHHSSPTAVDLSDIETKLNGIHKLLIILTDSGSTNER